MINDLMGIWSDFGRTRDVFEQIYPVGVYHSLSHRREGPLRIEKLRNLLPLESRTSPPGKQCRPRGTAPQLIASRPLSWSGFSGFRFAAEGVEIPQAHLCSKTLEHRRRALSPHSDPSVPSAQGSADWNERPPAHTCSTTCTDMSHATDPTKLVR